MLFLIRYVDEMKGNVDNLVTLCLDQIDADRLALRQQIEEPASAAGEGNPHQSQRRQLSSS